MRNFLTTKDIAELSGYSRCQIWKLAKANKIPGQRGKYCGARIRYIDSPVLRAWCQAPRWNTDEWLKTILEATVHEVIARDYLPNLDSLFRQELRRQLRESDDPDLLLKKWRRAMVERRPEDLPRIDSRRLFIWVLGEIVRQLVDSKNLKQLLKKWGRAIVDRRPEDLPCIP